MWSAGKEKVQMEIVLLIGSVIACIRWKPIRYFTEIVFLLSPVGWFVLVPMFGYAYVQTIKDYLLSMSIVYENGSFSEKEGYAERAVIYRIQKTVIILASVAVIGACVVAMILMVGVVFFEW